MNSFKSSIASMLYRMGWLCLIVLTFLDSVDAFRRKKRFKFKTSKKDNTSTPTSCCHTLLSLHFLQLHCTLLYFTVRVLVPYIFRSINRDLYFLLWAGFVLLLLPEIMPQWAWDLFQRHKFRR